RPLLLAVGAGLLGFVVQAAFGFTVVGCGTLFVTLAALLSRFGEPQPAEDAAPVGRAGFLVGLGLGGLAAGLVFLASFGASSLESLMARLPGGLGGVTALAAMGWAVSSRAAPTAVSPEPSRDEADDVPAATLRVWVLQLGAWAAAAALLAVLVVQPL